MEKKNILIGFLIAVVASVLTIVAYNVLDDSPTFITKNQSLNPSHALVSSGNYEPGATSFTLAAESTVHGVVHVKTMRERDAREIRNPLEFFFGPREREEEPAPDIGFGSGVIVSENGYIVTNYHVISDADEIEVTLNDQRTYVAEVEGTDPDTDIALLKIDETNLPHILFGNSDALKLGDWVLAVGNPFGLTSSVTAGIISAKERSLGVLRGSEMPIESFLQTDAAVNVGNSGGALVNLNGELVGVPTLILSPTRTNIGNAFAVPSSIVQRVVENIIEYGEVRRGILGVSIREVTAEMASEKGMEEVSGVFVEEVINGGAADQAGIRRGDIILKVEGNDINSTGELQRHISRHQPGERVAIQLRRERSSLELTAQLLGREEQRELIRQQTESLMGGTFKMVPQELKESLGLPGGVKVTELEPGPLKATGMREGFIIVAINRRLITEPMHVIRLLEDYSGNVYIEGVYSDGTRTVYAFSI